MPSALHPASETLLQHGDHVVLLRASLRAAVALDALPGGIPSVWDGIARQKLTSLHSVIRATATSRQEAERLITYPGSCPLAPFVSAAQAACIELIAGLFPVDQGSTDARRSEASKPLCEYLGELYRFGTGWLGWPPSEVWNASIAELETAFLAHVDRLVMMTPGAEADNRDAKNRTDHSNEKQRQENIAAGLDPDFDRAGLERLRNMA